MTALPEWMVLPPGGLTAADYEALPEEVCRSLEIVDGAIVVAPAPRRVHQIFARRLANVLEEATTDEWAVATDVDLRLRDLPLLNRRPGLVVFSSSLDEDAVLRPQHCLLVVEVMSPGSVTADQTDKPAEYAGARIPHFWRVEGLDGREPSLFRYRLDPTTRAYASAGVDTGKVTVTEPFEVTVDLPALL
ncbi:Uma2 family endonuclease [Amycolatopsis thermophila]|uniref:Uma2 family endonuclease n=1 Tax=Amycolatopsis thermophila TaxID=206084 RepID=A0ABU0EPI2_9PSEU|nr:Uma2 family endonuclease [Amycolatopsis thermophila]MDQ0376958.1 Uma2 family endonuclease [Amycolatopsis thermophila]